MLIKFPQKIGSVPDAGVIDEGKSNRYAHHYPGRRVQRVKVEDAVPNPAIVQHARDVQFTSAHTGLKDRTPEPSLKPRSGKAHVGGVGSVRTIGS